MSSIEWLFNELWETPKDKFEWYFILNKAKEMHKQEIIDAWNGGDYAYFYSKETGRDFADGNDYYQETFVSKGSETLKDYHIVDTNEMVELPQQEISDEEIEKAVKNPMHDAYDFREGAKWYREQLKQRQ